MKLRYTDKSKDDISTGFESDHGNLLLIQHKISVWIPFMVLRAPFWGPKMTL
jgi:hypothetical protein